MSINRYELTENTKKNIEQMGLKNKATKRQSDDNLSKMSPFRTTYTENIKTDGKMDYSYFI